MAMTLPWVSPSMGDADWLAWLIHGINDPCKEFYRVLIMYSAGGKSSGRP